MASSSIIFTQDKNLDNKEESAEKFKEIAEAYSILSDPKKRELYDQYGFAGIDPSYNNTPSNSNFRGGGVRFQPGTNFSHFSFSRANDIFENFFKDFGFDDDEDDFFGSGFGFSPFSNLRKASSRKASDNPSRSGSGFNLFNDPFFSTNLSDHMRDEEFFDSHSFGGGNGGSRTPGTSKSVSKTTRIM